MKILTIILLSFVMLIADVEAEEMPVIRQQDEAQWLKLQDQMEEMEPYLNPIYTIEGESVSGAEFKESIEKDGKDQMTLYQDIKKRGVQTGESTYQMPDGTNYGFVEGIDEAIKNLRELNKVERKEFIDTIPTEKELGRLNDRYETLKAHSEYIESRGRKRPRVISTFTDTWYDKNLTERGEKNGK